MAENVDRDIAAVRYHLSSGKCGCQNGIPDMMNPHKFSSFYPMSSSPSLSSISSAQPLPIRAEAWKIAEDKISKILSVVNPTPASERRRKEIIEYIQALFQDSFDIKVFPMGSVPLKTYLPDGDIDFTALSTFNAEYLAAKFCSLLEYEAKYNSEALVRDAHPILAKVKLVKCNVENIAVDISFNQMAGLCALSFLDEVDQFIGKQNLFKRSVILIKAWCFYESRILGAHHGLFATYALETMILHIMNLFHSSLPSPLAVLYKFLSYYTNFEWDSYCVSINGLVVASSLPKIIVKLPIDCDEALLDDELLRRCRGAALTSTGSLQSAESFLLKYLNIMDPLNDDNNLGRSINQGTCRRIQSALKHGLSTIEKLFTQPPESIGKGVEKFFTNTLSRNGKGRRADVVAPVLHYGVQRPEFSDPNEDNRNILTGIQYGLWYHNYGIGPSIPKTSPVQLYENSLNILWDNWVFYKDTATQSMEGLAPLVGSPEYTHIACGTMVQGNWNPRGTEPYIPNLRLQLGWNKYSEQRWKRLESQTTDGTPPPVLDASTLAASSDPTNMETESEKVGESRSTNLLAEEFPHIPGSGPSAKGPIAWLPKDNSAMMENILFGSFDSTSPRFDVPLPPSGEQMDSELSTNVDSMLSLADALETLEEQEDSMIVEKETFDLLQFELRNEEEFPCLIPKIDKRKDIVSSVDLQLETEPPCPVMDSEGEEVLMPPLSRDDDKRFPTIVSTSEEVFLKPPLELSSEGNPSPSLPSTKVETTVPQFELSNVDEFPPLLSKTQKQVVVPTPMKLEDRKEFPPLNPSRKPTNKAGGKMKMTSTGK